MRAIKLTTTLALALSAFAGRSFAAPQAPHDAAHNVTCNDCHIPAGGRTDAAPVATSTASAAGTKVLLTDTTATWPVNEWVGYLITFTSGANSGASRTITSNTATTVSWADDLLANVAQTDHYLIRNARLVASAATAGTTTGLTDMTATWTAGQWVGGVVTFTNGANVNEFRFITGNTATTLSWDVSLPLATPIVATDQYLLNQMTYDDVEVKCKVCHNPNGIAQAGSKVALHNSDVGVVGCGKCHEPHNVSPNSGLGLNASPYGNLIRDEIRVPGGIPTAVTYTPGTLIQQNGKGICQVCHTKTGAFLGGQTPPVSAAHHDYADAMKNPQGCQTAGCHGHDTSFNTAITGAHMDPAGLAWTYWHSGGKWTQACLRCHTDAGNQDYIGADGTADNHLSGTFNVDQYATGLNGGTLQCATCHNPKADGLNSVLFVSGFQYTGLNKQTAICAQCHQGRESTISVSKKFAALAETTTTGNTDAGAAGTTLTVGTAAWTVNGYQNWYALFTTGANLGVYRKIASNTATTLVWATALPAAVTAGQKFVIVNSTAAGTKPLDTGIAGSFTNSHYLASAGILFGAGAKIAYEYPNATSANTSAKATNVVAPPGAPMYSGKNTHGVNYDDCTSCHQQHTLEIKLEVCGNCHFKTSDGSPVATLADIENDYQYGYWGSVDGDNLFEGLKPEIYGTQNALGAYDQVNGDFPFNGILSQLYKGIVNYANFKLAKKICYDKGNYPYWFETANADGTCSVADPTMRVAYALFSPRLLRAAFNYNLFVREPGAWAHNPRYVVELAYDGIVDLNNGLTAAQKAGGTYVNPTFTLTVRRGFSGPDLPANPNIANSHFDVTANAFRFRDANGSMPYPCMRCHGGEAGLVAYLSSTSPYNQAATEFQNGVAPVMGQQCTTCHVMNPGDTNMQRIRDISATAIGGVRVPGHWAGGTFGPPTTVVLNASNFTDPRAMICASCHQSRDINKVGLDQYLAGAWSGIDVIGLPFSGAAASIVQGATSDGAGGKYIKVTGLPTAQPANAYGTLPNNWIATYAAPTTCLLTPSAGKGAKYITITGAANANYNGTWAIAACQDGYVELKVTYAGDDVNNAAVAWSAYTASTKNVHDIQPGASVFGSVGGVGYQYGANSYAGVKLHGAKKADCLGCHQPKTSRHTMNPPSNAAAGGCRGNGCHADDLFDEYSNAARNLKTGPGYDSDVNTTTLDEELQTFSNKLAAAMNLYARTQGVYAGADAANPPTLGNICWENAPGTVGHHSSNGWYAAVGNVTGICAGNEANSWAGYDKKMVRAAYNMSMNVDGNVPAAWAHNFDYTAQLLFDSIVDLGGDTTGLTRP